MQRIFVLGVVSVFAASPAHAAMNDADAHAVMAKYNCQAYHTLD